MASCTAPSIGPERNSVRQHGPQAKHARRESSPTRAFAHTWRQKPVSPIRTIGHAFGTCKQVSEIRVLVMPRTPIPVDIRKIAQPASMYDWQEGPPQQ